MKKDIVYAPVAGVSVAVVRQQDEPDAYGWTVVLFNENDAPITNVFVTSRGYTDQQETSVLRHFFAEILPQSNQIIESIVPEVFGLNNEFWVSYYIKDQVFDKKFIFPSNCISTQNLVILPTLNRPGILAQ